RGGEEQVILRARAGDVEDTQILVPLLELLAGLPEAPPGRSEWRRIVVARRACYATEGGIPGGEGEERRAALGVEVGQDDDGKLQSLRLVDRHEPDHVGVLRLRRGLLLTRLRLDEIAKSLDELRQPEESRAVEGAGQVEQLPEVRQLALAEELDLQRGVVTGV